MMLSSVSTLKYISIVLLIMYSDLSRYAKFARYTERTKPPSNDSVRLIICEIMFAVSIIYF